MKYLRHPPAWALLVVALACTSARAQNPVLFSELLYHPVEKAAFDANGLPVLDLQDDVHEFVELHNTGSTTVDLNGWKLGGGVSFDFPAGSSVAPGGFVVIAKNPVRLAAIPAYGLTTNQILGPYSGQLGNREDTIRLRNALDEVVDSVSYSASFPWAIAADALGADDEWTGLNSAAFQYQGRSLERVSFTSSANDPANWLASPLATGPSPGRTNSFLLTVPRPVVVAFSAVQPTDASGIIRSNSTVRVDVLFSATNQISDVTVEYFVDNINLTNEARLSVALNAVSTPSDGRYAGSLPQQPDRSVVRYRVRADRGGGVETVSPRADDPFAWHAYFVTPARVSANPIYELFISTASLSTLSANISQSPRRVTLPDPPGTPRASWDATEPAVFVHNGRVYDIRVRYHGSRYNRNPGESSFKFQFPDYATFNGRKSYFETEKMDEHRLGSRIYEAVDFPAWRCRYVDLYVNANGLLTRLEQEELDRENYERWMGEQEAKHPGDARPALGETYKATGVVPYETATGQGTAASYEGSGEGPYYIGNGAPIPPKTGWSLAERYDWTYGLQVRQWQGGAALRDLITALWAARGDTPTAPNPNLPALRAFLTANFDVDATLTYIAIRNWSAPFDNATHNHFIWHEGDGRWAMLPWDLDGEFRTASAAQSIFWDEYAVPQPDALRGPEWLKDSFLKAFREEYRQKAFILNNTLLSPVGLTAIGAAGLSGYASVRQPIVNTELGLGAWAAPLPPVNLAPPSNAPAFPPDSLRAAGYQHGDVLVPAHASTTWLLRRASATYSNPVVRVTSTTNLTSLPIPFDDLAFGETYFWKCSFTDVNGHPSAESAETSFVFGAAPVVVPLVAIDASTVWRYDQSGTNPPANWFTDAFDDRDWLSGPALLAFENAPLPEPVRTPIVLGTVVTHYFRTRFVFPGDPAGATLRLRQVVDDGVVIYLNGAELARRRMPPGPPNAATPANAAVDNATYEGPFPFSGNLLVPGTNLLAAEVHQSVNSGNDVVFGLTLEVALPPGAGDIRLNEILADNRHSITNGGYTSDYIELFNQANVPQALDHFSLSDDPGRPGRFIFPPGTLIPAQGFLTVWCDTATNAPGLHTGFALDSDGQTVALFVVTPQGNRLLDSVRFGLQIPDYSIGRDGPEWTLAAPTPNATNATPALAAPGALRINEWLASNTTGPDWLELYNPDTLPIPLGGLFLSDSPAERTNTRIAALSFIAGHGHRRFFADSDPGQGVRHVNFRLGAGGDSIVLSAANLAAIDAVSFGAQAADVSQGRLPDGSTTIASFPGSGSPEAPNYLAITGVILNELLPDIELRNLGSTPVTVSGWWLSDDPAAPQKYQIPPGVTIPPGEVWFVDDDELPFDLRAHPGGQVILSHDGLYRTRQTFDVFDGLSQGPVPTSVGVDFVRLSNVTFGAQNSGPQVGPAVMSEIQYHPPDLPGDDDDYEFIELANLTGDPVNLFLSGHPEIPWRLRDAVTFRFPTNSVLGGGDRVLVLGFDPATNAVALSNFLAVYDVPPGTRLFGPYSGKLDNAGASLELVEDQPAVTIPGPDYGRTPEALLERVRFGDSFPWPAAADGSGSALQRRVLSSYGNEPTNWFASGASPGRANATNAAPLISLTAPSAGGSSGFGLPITLAANATDADGTVRRVEFFVDNVLVGESAGPGFTVIWTNGSPGVHIISARATDNRLGITFSAPISFTVINLLPTVAITAPTNGSFITLPTNIQVTAAADDADGRVVVVEFFASGRRLGSVAAPPFSLVWTSPPSGAYTVTAVATDNAGASVTSASVSIIAAREISTAYLVESNTVGTQTLPNPYALGMDFNVLSPVIVTHLGCFDSAGDGLSASSVLTTQIYNRNGPTPVVAASTNFSSTDPGVLAGGSRFKPLASPVVLTNGFYSVVGYGYDGNNRNGNLGTGNAKTWTTEDGGGLLAFVGGGRYGAVTPGSLPGTLDGGPPDRYAAGTFRFRRVTPSPTIVSPPANAFVRRGSNATFSVSVVGDAPLRYQWTFNGSAIAGATGNILTVTNAQAASEGTYFVTITNAAGSVTSAPVRLLLLINPGFLVAPTDQVVPSNGTFSVSVVLTGAPPPFRYEWREVSTVRGFTNSDARTNFFSFGPVTNLAPRLWRLVVTNAALVSPALVTNFTVTTLPDTDGDGMPDAWEAQFGLNPNSAADRNGDADGDGASNWQEYQAGTDATNRASFLKIEPFTAGGGATLAFGALAGRTYTVQHSSDLGAGPWTRLVDVIALLTNRTEVIFDPVFTTNRFYRITTPRQP